MPLLGSLPHSLRATVERWIADAQLSDPNKLHENGSLFIAAGPAWCNSISPDGTIWIDDYSNNAAVLVDEAARIKTIVIAGKYRPELLEWLPKREETATDCSRCNASGWLRFSTEKFICETCSGLGWLPLAEIA